MGPELKFALHISSSSSIACVTRCEISYWWLHLRHQQDSPWLFLFRRKCCSIQMAEITVVSIVMVLATTFMHSTVGKPMVRSINWPLYNQTFVLMISWVLSRFTLYAVTFKKMQETSQIACVLKLPRSQIAEALILIEILISVLFHMTAIFAGKQLV